MAMTYVAQLFVAPSPDSLTLSDPLLALKVNLRAEEIMPILQKHGLEDMQSGQWLNLQQVLNVFRDIVDLHENVTDRLVSIGRAGMETVPLPPEIDTIMKALHMLDHLTRMNNKNVPPEYGFIIHELGPTHLYVKQNTPFDPYTAYGFIEAVVNRLKPEGDLFVVRTLSDPNDGLSAFDIRWGADEEDLEDEALAG